MKFRNPMDSWKKFAADFINTKLNSYHIYIHETQNNENSCTIVKCRQYLNCNNNYIPVVLLISNRFSCLGRNSSISVIFLVSIESEVLHIIIIWACIVHKYLQL